MSKQKAKTVDMSVSIEEAEKQHLKELELRERDEKEAKKAAKEEKKEAIEEKIEAKAREEAVKPKAHAAKPRSHTYRASRAQVDRTKAYPLTKACTLLIKTSYSSFPGTVSAELILRDQKTQADVTFPHSTGKTIRVAIADEALLAKIEKGELDFDVLVTKPDMMPKLAKFARVLGPKGLMPNPKNQTITPDPEKRAKELSSGKTTLKTEKKAPLMHITLGKTDLGATKLQANCEALIKAVGGRKIIKLVLSATMSPGIKVDLTPYQLI